MLSLWRCDMCKVHYETHSNNMLFFKLLDRNFFFCKKCFKILKEFIRDFEREYKEKIYIEK